MVCVSVYKRVPQSTKKILSLEDKLQPRNDFLTFKILKMKKNGRLTSNSLLQVKDFPFNEKELY